MGKRWQGIGASTGRGAVEGVALVSNDVRSAVERLLDIPEDQAVVLVTPWVPPEWSSILRRVAGVITEVVSVLSNSMIIAHELRLAVVAGLDDATSNIRDGQRVRVDGASGTVEVLEE